MKVLITTTLFALSGCLADRPATPDTSDTPDDTVQDSADNNTADTRLSDTAVDTGLPDSAPDATGSDTTGNDTTWVEGVVTPRVEIGGQSVDRATPGQPLELSVEVGEGALPVAGYRWSVDQPSDSYVTFLPGADIEAPTFTPWVVGTYTFYLDVIDTQGVVRRAGSHLLRVAPTDGLHVELTWRTPGDPDESDSGGAGGSSAGSDVDLHLRHAQSDKWFDWTYDCYWENPNPEWGFFGGPDNPALDRDDTDGAGPEVISLESPEANTYRVGVHYWSDWSYGPSIATVRIFLGGVLVESWETELVDSDLWESHLIDPTSGTVERLTTQDGEPQLIPAYPFLPGQ